MEFTKMHGCGNDYIYINCFDAQVNNLPELSMVLCDRRKYIGGDGIITIEKSQVADAKMRIFNKDGSEGKMCGNGIRCVAKYLYDNKICNNMNNIKIETLSGVKYLDILENNKNESVVKVNMGQASLNPKDIPVLINKEKIVDELITIDDNKFYITCVSVGNPHCVIFVDEVCSIDLNKIAPKLSSNIIFPEGINIEFVSIIDKNNISMRVWERGSGETLSCGSGSCASVVAAVENNYCDRNTDITVHLRGGSLKINYDENSVVYMTGNATKVFEGVIEI
ncbi:MAG: diaminopimelate epimerase [Clostridia bacterium]|nr:diaminopimelate epimerase [Clostridia bacterium]